MNKEDNFIIYGKLVFIFYVISMTLVVFLNIFKVIKMSWFWAFSPLWILAALFVIGFVIYKIFGSGGKHEK